MASITTVTPKPFKQYEFCDGIKAHILSYLGAKKMKYTDVAASGWKDKNYLTIRSQIYYIRMAVSHEQLLWELTTAGQAAGLREIKCLRHRLRRESGGSSGADTMMFYLHAQGKFAPIRAYDEFRLSASEKTCRQTYRKRLLDEINWGYHHVVVRGQMKREKEAQLAGAKRRIADAKKVRVDCNCGCGKNIAKSTWETHRRKWEKIHPGYSLGAP